MLFMTNQALKRGYVQEHLGDYKLIILGVLGQSYYRNPTQQSRQTQINTVRFDFNSFKVSIWVHTT